MNERSKHDGGRREEESKIEKCEMSCKTLSLEIIVKSKFVSSKRLELFSLLRFSIFEFPIS